MKIKIYLVNLLTINNMTETLVIKPNLIKKLNFVGLEKLDMIKYPSPHPRTFPIKSGITLRFPCFFKKIFLLEIRALVDSNFVGDF